MRASSPESGNFKLVDQADNAANRRSTNHRADENQNDRDRPCANRGDKRVPVYDGDRDGHGEIRGTAENEEGDGKCCAPEVSVVSRILLGRISKFRHQGLAGWKTCPTGQASRSRITLAFPSGPMRRCSSP